jgi:hypothetical protein
MIGPPPRRARRWMTSRTSVSEGCFVDKCGSVGPRVRHSFPEIEIRVFTGVSRLGLRGRHIAQISRQRIFTPQTRMTGHPASTRGEVRGPGSGVRKSRKDDDWHIQRRRPGSATRRDRSTHRHRGVASPPATISCRTLVSSPTRAITIDPRWRGVAVAGKQMGQGRGGLYSCDFLENAVAHCDIHSVDRIVPEWQQVMAGATRCGSTPRCRWIEPELRLTPSRRWPAAGALATG